MTTTLDRPRFTTDARGHYPCPAPECRRTFNAAAGVGRHWSTQHATTPAPVETKAEQGTGEDQVDTWHRQMYPDAYDADGNLIDDTPDEDEAPSAASPAPPQREAEVESPGEAVEASPTPPARPGVSLLTWEQLAEDRPGRVAELVEGVDILSSATARLVGVGYDPDVAQEYVLHLIDLLVEVRS
ncbi:hypothetical protein [Serinicoccus sediminis]|uniref:hypothetical protein n=1 Tax=Serinicoccus sediminis TaxID=2306021 RepID=UPI001020582A|nr:hypothetical protein [Serinicoccus sediminis]